MTTANEFSVSRNGYPPRFSPPIHNPVKKNENVTKFCDICDICDMVGQVTVLGQSVGKGGALGDQKVEKKSKHTQMPQNAMK